MNDQPEICLEGNTCYLGSWMFTDKNTKFATFQGIRYAEPPLGNLRYVNLFVEK